ncbi:hypothetical protein A3J90_08915 [candidate division WOR-1 bacterium RIFOXYC2_FULL_37_10]|uniref:Polymerase beta nucleotidyltransferase domain-containing protein n=1 Tax=candidate division WOR-1 bacterium RIFOXYB2_FULL_37_13 TaxID=1802579 RepID=A0A1F4SUV1_UNCSA|nr:MAG: hypothetical protein A2246_03420 [candidate division WOR-1 bacterium RIFOXYA2_FULL_37_7]OGC24200.1 MAG: hypothetical protein A2310_06615 [candidate division WOR-1 bacterium RIFOXYB2_FULL_37_13]OGC36573.1 MAG: hypothetical protein A3J90_08915 [candidate division WOR-1 bacterium RIFOXYC2_FULL_37_10]
MDKRIIEQLKDFFASQEKIKLAFLFGSQSKGRGIAESDFDIAVWPDDSVTEKEMTSIWVELQRLLKTSVDLVDLSSARATIAWEAFRGTPLSIKDEFFYINKMLEVSSEAEDFQDFVLDVWRLRQEAEKE